MICMYTSGMYLRPRTYLHIHLHVGIFKVVKLSVAARTFCSFPASTWAQNFALKDLPTRKSSNRRVLVRYYEKILSN